MMKGLVLIKKPKLLSLLSKLEKLSKFDESYLEIQKRMEVSKATHEYSVDLFKSAIKRHNLQVDYSDSLAQNSSIGEVINNYSFVWSLGGDGHFLRVANYIKNDKLPLIGINTDPERSGGFLWNFQIHKDDQVQELDGLMEKLTNFDTTQAYYRTRISTENNRYGERIHQSLCLNEAILEESYGAKTCAYGMKVDDKIEFNKIKSSGLIVATGSGSTGLLLSARRLRISQLESFINKNDENKLVKLQQMQSELRIPGDSKQFYYFNRELCLPYNKFETFQQKDLETLSRMEEGFWDFKLVIKNLNMDGNILIDGLHTFKVEYGDAINISIGPSLKCISI